MATRIGLFLLGIAMAIFGVAVIVYCYAFASMVDPTLGPLERVREILCKMFLSPSVVVVCLGVSLICVGSIVSTTAVLRRLPFVLIKASGTVSAILVLSVLASLVFLFL
jgi:hypothetical protein